MVNQKYENLEQDLAKKTQKREKKQRERMKVSGAGVKKLGKIIKDKHQ